CARLVAGGFSLLDTQFVTEHLRQFGTVELDRNAFHALLEKALAHQADFAALPQSTAPNDVLAVLDGGKPLSNRAPHRPSFPALAAISHNGVQFKVTGVREALALKRMAAGRPLPSPLVAGGAGSAMFPLWLILGWVGGGQAATAALGGAFTSLSRSMARRKTF